MYNRKQEPKMIKDSYHALKRLQKMLAGFFSKKSVHKKIALNDSLDKEPPVIQVFSTYFLEPL